MKPEIKHEDGKLYVSMVAGLDTDKDGVQSATAKVEITLDAAEVVNEIIKKEVPAWLKGLIAAKV